MEESFNLFKDNFVFNKNFYDNFASINANRLKHKITRVKTGYFFINRM